MVSDSKLSDINKNLLLFGRGVGAYYLLVLSQLSGLGLQTFIVAVLNCGIRPINEYN